MPKKADRGFNAAYLQFQNNQLTGLKIVNQLNQTNVFTFSQIRINPNLSPSLFNFKPPAGVQVLKNNGQKNDSSHAPVIPRDDGALFSLKLTLWYSGERVPQHL